MASHVHMQVNSRVHQPPQPGAGERRRAPRYQAHIAVELRGGGIGHLETIDVSRHGLLVPGDCGLRVGTTVAIAAQLPDGPMRAMAVPVRQVKSDDGEVVATALVLFGVGTELRRRWEHFVSGVAGLPSAPGLASRPWEYGLLSARLGGAAIDRLEVAQEDDDLFDPDDR